MPTGRIILPAPAFIPDSSDNPVLDFLQAAGNAANPRLPVWVFADIDDIAWIHCTFRMPADYASNPVFKWDWFTPDISEDYVRWQIMFCAISAGQTVPTATPAAAANADWYGGNVANELIQSDYDLSSNDDGLAANSLATLIVGIDSSQGAGYIADTINFLGGIVEYTKT